MKLEEGAVRLILAAAEFSSFTYSQLTKTWHRALAAVLGCPSWWLPYLPPVFPRHRNARSVPGSPTSKISAATCRQHDLKQLRPAKRSLRQQSRGRMDQCWQLQSTASFAAEPSICSTLDSSRHSQGCFMFQQRGNILPATPEPQKPWQRHHPSSLASKYSLDLNLGLDWSQERHSEKSQALVCAAGEFGCLGCRLEICRKTKQTKKYCVHAYTWKKLKSI